MKFSYNWLKELSGANESAKKIAELLMLHSFEVEGLEKPGGDFEKVVVGEILEIKKHPNADRLQLVTVDIGKEKLEVVCGAFNIKTGDKVPVALVGAKLVNGVVEEAEIRGVKSRGMLCAEDELGLGDDHSGILILDKNAKLGDKLSKVLGSDDYVLDVDILPNRAHDSLSHWGVAREIGALCGSPLKFDEKKYSLENYSGKNGGIEVEIADANLCPRYIGVVLENIKIGESPDWMKARLTACGMKPINNVVDITNYVMLETGQPLHAFDARQVADKKIVVRRAEPGEKLVLLDDTELELSEDNLLITDPQKLLALAGVMGGKFSGISDDTVSVVLESANFNFVSIRKTKSRFGLNTEAAYRFEREIDPNLCEIAAVRAIELLKELAGAEVKGFADNYPNPVKPWLVNLDTEYVKKLLGEEISLKEQIKILESLGFSAKQLEEPKDQWLAVEVPTRRIDVKTQEDLIEEIGRIFGYEKIKPAEPYGIIIPPRINEDRIFERQLKEMLVGFGMDEVYNYSFYGTNDAKNCGLDSIEHWELENPMNPEQQLLRINLVPELLRNASDNQRYFDSFRIFEIGRVYFNKNGEPQEKNMLAGLLVSKNKEEKLRGESFYEAKGIVDELAGRLGVEELYYDSYEPTPKDTTLAMWHPTRLAEIKSGNCEIGFIGEINPIVAGRFGIDGRVAAFEIDVEKLKLVSAAGRDFRPLGKYPTSTRDISMIIGEKITVADILKVVQLAGGKLVLDVDLFDIYENIPEEAGKKSLAFHIVLGSDAKTLSTEEVDSVMKKITRELEKSLGAKVRK